MQTEIDYRLIGRKAVNDWHDEEGIGNPENELLAGLAASIFSVRDIPEEAFINCIKVVLASAFQLGRANSNTGEQNE